MEQTEKTSHTPVYEASTICEHRDCEVILTDPTPNQKFCSTFCHDEEWRKIRADGLAKKKSIGMHYQSLNSPIVQKMLAYLSDGKPHTSIQVIQNTMDCGFRATISTLRKHGFDIECTYKGTRKGRKIYEYQLKLEV
jgi:hypothetical protein